MKSLLWHRSNSRPQNAGGNGLDMPPTWFLVGAYVATCILIAGSWFAVEFASWSWDRVIGSVILGSALIVAILGTAIEISSQAAMCRVARNVRTGWRLFAYGVAFVFFSIPLALGIWWSSGLVLEALPLAGFRAKAVAYIVAGLVALVLSTAIVMRLLALTSRKSTGEGAAGPTERPP